MPFLYIPWCCCSLDISGFKNFFGRVIYKIWICENLHHGDMIAIKIFTRTQMKRGCEATTTFFCLQMTCLIAYLVGTTNKRLYVPHQKHMDGPSSVTVTNRMIREKKIKTNTKNIIKMVDWWLKRPWVSRCMIYLSLLYGTFLFVCKFCLFSFFLLQKNILCTMIKHDRIIIVHIAWSYLFENIPSEYKRHHRIHVCHSCDCNVILVFFKHCIKRLRKVEVIIKFLSQI